MPISTPLVVATQASVPGASPFTVPLTANVNVGDCFMLFTGTSAADSTQTVTGVSDSQGNPWTKLGNGGTTFGATTWVCPFVRTALVAGTDLLSITASATGNVMNIIGCTMSSVLSTSPQDGYGLTSSGSAGTTASRSTATAAQANEIVFAQGAWANAGGVPSWAAPLTALTTAHTGSTAYLAVAYAIRTVTTSFTASATIGSANWTLITVGLRDALPTLPQQIRMRRPAVFTRIATRRVGAVYGR